MKLLTFFLDICRTIVRGWMRHIARLLNRLTGGRLSPNAVTIIGLLAHLPIAWLIANGDFWWAAGLLVVFGLFDALDGELARLQQRASSAGMLLDATTDRMKETALYCGVAYALIASDRPVDAVWAVAACGASLCVSYVKAKGETAVSGGTLTPNEINRLFQDGLLRFEVRMTLLVIGLVTGWLAGVVIVIAVLSSFTAIDRLVRITQKLQTSE
jgi:CDP-diacylglycerol--glycerol-3-phosphate 3-phosphatidyltransferase